MDVEAQEEGVLAKILITNGTQNVSVGRTIAVLAEQGDDISTLQLPTEDSEIPPPPQPSSNVESQSSPVAQSQNQEPSSHKSNFHFADTYTPAVLRLLYQYGVDDPKAIKSTGPQGRLLKGDVLAHVGSIKQDAPTTLNKILAKKQTLDLSNIEVKPPQPPPSSSGPQPLATAKPRPLATVNASVNLVALSYSSPDLNGTILLEDVANA
jgi:pyruvate/2-oxoglutarate dehydrogenase complex dihydrolipoamide acyltransferase (E2) component